jgi:transcriptional regulator with XRE-family HTH domain
MNDFGRLLTTYRKPTGISQSKLGELSDFDHSYVSRLEGGLRNPTRDAVDRFSAALMLDDEQAEALMNAAGFLTGEQLPFRTLEAREVDRLLVHPNLPEPYGESVRVLLASLANQLSTVIKMHGGELHGHPG